MRILLQHASSLLLLASLTYPCVASSPNRWGIHSASRNIYPAFSLPVETVTSARDNLLSYSNQLNAESKTGVFVGDLNSKKKLKKLVAELEAVSDPPSSSSTQTMVGDWKLLCTTQSIAAVKDDRMAASPKKKKGLFPASLLKTPGFLKENLDPVQKKIRESVEVIQRIRSSVGDNNSSAAAETSFNRVDNVIQFTPFSLSDLWNGSVNVNLNPLEVSKTKVALVHSADVQSTFPVLRTKLVLKSVVLTIAGTSQYLEPSGADILGLNVPLGELFNFGSFDTTYVDDNIRVSRGKVGVVEQLRVFTRVVHDDLVTEEEEPTNEEAWTEEEEEKAEVKEVDTDVTVVALTEEEEEPTNEETLTKEGEANAEFEGVDTDVTVAGVTEEEEEPINDDELTEEKEEEPINDDELTEEKEEETKEDEEVTDVTVVAATEEEEEVKDDEKLEEDEETITEKITVSDTTEGKEEVSARGKDETDDENSDESTTK